MLSLVRKHISKIKCGAPKALFGKMNPDLEKHGGGITRYPTNCFDKPDTYRVPLF